MASRPTNERIRSFRTNPARELGLDSTEAQNQALQIALSHPAEYFKLRNTLLQAVVKNHVNLIYGTVWNALTEGRHCQPDGSAGSEILRLTTPLDKYQLNGVAHFRPLLPESQVNAIALSIASGYKELMDTQLVERILPKNLHELAIQKTAARTASKIASGSSDL